jgi:hypothetical protein
VARLPTGCRPAARHSPASCCESATG